MYRIVFLWVELNKTCCLICSKCNSLIFVMSTTTTLELLKEIRSISLTLIPIFLTWMTFLQNMLKLLRIYVIKALEVFWLNISWAITNFLIFFIFPPYIFFLKNIFHSKLLCMQYFLFLSIQILSVRDVSCS